MQHQQKRTTLMLLIRKRFFSFVVSCFVLLFIIATLNRCKRRYQPLTLLLPSPSNLTAKGLFSIEMQQEKNAQLAW